MLKRAFLAYVLVELAVLVGLTWAVGLGWTLLVLLSTAVVGFAMAGSQARRQLMRLQEFQANPRGANPRGVVADSAMIAMGTVLVFIPGLVSSLIGSLMLLPPTRSAIRPVAGVLLNRGLLAPSGRVTVMSVGGPYQPYPGGYTTYADVQPDDPQPGYGDYIDGEVIEGQVYGPVHEAGIVRRHES